MWPRFLITNKSSSSMQKLIDSKNLSTLFYNLKINKNNLTIKMEDKKKVPDFKVPCGCETCDMCTLPQCKHRDKEGEVCEKCSSLHCEACTRDPEKRT